MNQYCRYCAYALDYNGEETEFLCEIKDEFFPASKAKHINRCKDFDFNPSDIFRTLPNGSFAQYQPRAPYKPKYQKIVESGQTELNVCLLEK